MDNTCHLGLTLLKLKMEIIFDIISYLLLKREPSLIIGNMDNKINDCNHNESDRNDIPPQNLETNSNVTKYDRVIKKPARFRDT